MNTVKITLEVNGAARDLAAKSFKFSPKLLNDSRSWGRFLDDERAARLIRRGDKKALSALGLDLGHKGEMLYHAAHTALVACVALSRDNTLYRPCAWVADVANDGTLRDAAGRVEAARLKMAELVKAYAKYKRDAELTAAVARISGEEAEPVLSIEEYYAQSDYLEPEAGVYDKAQAELAAAIEAERKANADAVERFPAVSAMINRE